MFSDNALAKHFEIPRMTLARTHKLCTDEEWERTVDLALATGRKPFYSLRQLANIYGCSRMQMWRIITKYGKGKRTIGSGKIVVLLINI